MKGITSVHNGFLARVAAPRIAAEGTFPTRELADAAASIALDQIARGVAPVGSHDLTAEGLQPRLRFPLRASPRHWIEKQMAAPMRPKGRQRELDEGLFNNQRELL
jgi:hypothetical protein